MARRDLREAILEAALRLSAQDGFDTLSTAEVCRAAGASNGSMFHHFPTKAALGAALYLRTLEHYQDAIAASLEGARTARDGIRGLVLTHVRWVLAHPVEARLLHERRRSGQAPDGEVDARNRAFLARISAWLRPHLEAGRVRGWPPDVLVAVLFGPVHALTRGWMRGEPARRLEAAAPHLADAAWAALAAPARR